MLKNTQVFSNSPVHCDPLCLKCPVLAPVSFKAPPPAYQMCPDWSAAHAGASIANNIRAALLNEFLCAKVAAVHNLCKCVM